MLRLPEQVSEDPMQGYDMPEYADVSAFPAPQTAAAHLQEGCFWPVCSSAVNLSSFGGILSSEEADRLDREIEAHDQKVRELAAQRLGKVYSQIALLVVVECVNPSVHLLRSCHSCICIWSSQDQASISAESGDADSGVIAGFVASTPLSLV